MCLGASVFSYSQVNITTQRADDMRTGWYPNESVLTPKNVTTSTFGLLYNLPVDGQVYAQPLSVAGVAIPGQGTHNVIYVATENNSVYAFDASHNGPPLWHKNFGSAVPSEAVGVADINPQIGITGTPVINLTGPGQGYIYFVTKTQYEADANVAEYAQQLHALDITTGQESLGGPVTISAVVPGTGDGTDGNGFLPFNSLLQNQRAALLLFQSANTKTIYITWASHGDNGPYHGWIMGYDASSLKQVAAMCTSPNSNGSIDGDMPVAGGGIWQGGTGPATDGSSIYLATGNGSFNPAQMAFGDTLLKLTPSLTVRDFFTPFNEETLNLTDGDLGSGGVILLPNEAGAARNPYLMVATGKTGTIYLVNRASLGLYNGISDKIVQEL